MPQKTPEEIIQRILSLYSEGHSSSEISAETGVSPSVVCRYARRAGIARDQSEAKKAQYLRRPKPKQLNEPGRVYSTCADGVKVCASCKSSLPATLEHFYKRTRNGRINLSSSCRECVKQQRAQWREENHDEFIRRQRASHQKFKDVRNRKKREAVAACPELRQKRREASKEWYGKNKDRVRAYKVAYLEAHRERIAERAREYRANNLEKYRAHRRNRKARARNAEGSFTHEDVAALYVKQDGCCYWCSVDLGDRYEVDHYIPLAKGGTNNPDNLVLACQTCNASKGAKMPDEFRAYLETIAGLAEEIAQRRAYMRQKMREHRQRKRRDATIEA